MKCIYMDCLIAWGGWINEPSQLSHYIARELFFSKYFCHLILIILESSNILETALLEG